MYEGDRGRLRCSDDETHYYINDALWYRLFPNGTVHRFGSSGHRLIFNPFVRPEDQGIYYCCKPGGPCSGNSSVAIAGTSVYIHRYNSLLCWRYVAKDNYEGDIEI